LIKQDNPENNKNLIDIAYAMAEFFDKNNKRFNDFSNRKFVEIHIQDTILKTINNLSKVEECCHILLKSEFANDFISYINNFIKRKSDSQSENTDKKSSSSLKNKDYLLYITEKKKRKINIEITIKICYSILLSIINIVYNFALQENTIFDQFAVVVINFLIFN